MLKIKPVSLHRPTPPGTGDWPARVLPWLSAAAVCARQGKLARGEIAEPALSDFPPGRGRCIAWNRWRGGRWCGWLGRCRAERSAAWLAHQSGGLGVGSSNLPAPTNKIKELQNGSLFLGTA